MRNPHTSPDQRIAVTDIPTLTIWLSVLLFLISLTQDAFSVDRPHNGDPLISGFGAFLLGWLLIFDGGFSWLANPMLLVAWLMAFHPTAVRKAILVDFITMAIMLSFLLQDNILTDTAGTHHEITCYGLGYWLWVASAGTLVLGAAIRLRTSATE